MWRLRVGTVAALYLRIAFSESIALKMLEFVARSLIAKFYDSPIFVVGTGRSGTSVLLQALGKHPAIIAMPGEAPFLTSVGGDTALFEYADNYEYYQRSLNLDPTYLFDTLKRLGIEIAAGRYYGIKYVTQQLIQRRCLPGKIRYWAAKTFPPEISARGLIKLYPDTRFLYVTRSGIDVVNSMQKFHGFQRDGFEYNCARWSKEVEKYRFLTQLPQAISLKHEDLVQIPTDFFKRIFKFLQLEESQAVLDFTAHTIVHPLDQPDQQAANSAAVFKARTSPFLSWPQAQQSLFREICGQAMHELGYEIPEN